MDEALLKGSKAYPQNGENRLLQNLSRFRNSAGAKTRIKAPNIWKWSKLYIAEPVTFDEFYSSLNVVKIPTYPNRS